MVPVVVFITAMTVQLILTGIIDRRHQREDVATDLIRKTSDLLVLTYEYGVARSDRSSKQWAFQHAILDRKLKESAALMERPEEQELIRDLGRNHADAGKHFSEILELDRGQGLRRTAEQTAHVRTNLLNNLILELQDILPLAEKIRDINYTEEKRFSRIAGISMVTLAFSLLLSIPPIALVTVRRITARIDNLQESMKIIASGNLRHRVPIDTTDEIGALAQGFNEMTDKLSEVTVGRDELAREVEERRRAESALVASEAGLREAQRLAKLGSWELDLRTNALRWSDEIYRMFEIDKERFGATYEAFLNAIHPEDRDKVNRAYTDALKNKTSYEIDHRLLMTDGRIKFVHEQCETAYDAEGMPLRSIGTVQDITERRRAEIELRASEQRLKLHILQTPLGVIEWNLNFEVTRWNPAAETIFGYRREEAMGAHASILIPEHARAQVDRIWQDLVGKKGGTRSTNENATKDGRLIFCEWYNTPLIDESGQVVGVASLVQDVTERRKAEEEVRKLNEELEQRVVSRTVELETKGKELQDSQAALMNIVEDLNEKTAELEAANEKLKGLDRMKSMFIASMSHELRTPLNSIIGFSSIMLNEWTGPVTAEQKENLSAVMRSGKHLLSLINDVIDVSKIEAGKVESIAEEFDIRHIIQETVAAFKGDIEKKRLALQVRAAPQAIRGDRRRILQCLLNLVSNAVKFTDKGTITIDTALSGEGRILEIGVADTGIGLTPEDAQKLFAPFFRVSTPTRQLVPGTGLGLYLSKKLVQDVLGGDILVESAFGEGSRFVLKVPVTADRRDL